MSENKTLNRERVVERLTGFRQMWECAADDLIGADVSMGLLLADMLAVLELDEQEKTKILGPILVLQITRIDLSPAEKAKKIAQ